MVRAFRLMLTWLLAAALPIQGASAATMLSCDDAHHSPAALQMHDHTHGHAGGHHAHIAGAGAGAFEQSDSAQSIPGTLRLAKTANHKCSACASCCLSAFATASSLCFETEQLAELFEPLVTRILAAYVTEGLERPPRSLLA